MFKYFKGFTLAEILITLTVIGVVSALTLPNVMKKYNEFVIKKRLAKFYSNISQAYNRAYNDNGMVMNCFYILDKNNNVKAWNGNQNACINDGKAVFKYLKVIKSCRFDSGKNQCMGASYPKIYQNDYNYYYFLSDGVIIITYWTNSLIQFSVDLNGKNLPNKKGYDIFEFITVKDKERFFITPYNSTVETGGKTTKEMLENFNN